ncbi:MAG: RibD family protein [Methylococcaceae bacterium]|nr:RibD family protein [Methylococcaceae bacterium]
MTVHQQIEYWLNAHKIANKSAQRPFVTLSYAQSWDGSITTRSGATLALSGTEATRLTHHLRSLHDGILVGIGTVLTDDPQLTVRDWPGANPQAIVLDSQLRMPPTARLCQHADKSCWILTCVNEGPAYGSHVEVITLARDAEARVNLSEALAVLWDKGIKMLMVEGGSEVITAFLKAQLADALVLTIAPTLVGGYKGVGHLGINSKSHMPQIRQLHTQMLGDDVIMWGNLHFHQQLAPC